MHEPTPDISLSQLERFRPSLAWFARDGSGVHGVAHEARVLIWTQVLAAWLEAEGKGDEAPANGLGNVLGWAAAVHDTQRFDDGIDPEHGERAAEWLLGMDGVGGRGDVVSDGTAIEDVAYLCRWHVPSDAKAPRMTLLLKAFKDADALDRWRIGDLNVRYLRLERSRELVEPARRLWAKTASVGLEEPRGAFEAVMRAGVELGIVSLP